MTKSTFNPNRPVQTRDGKPARILCTDRKGNPFSIIALVTRNLGKDGTEITEQIATYLENGRYDYEETTPLDLINVPLSSEEYVAKKGAVCPVCGTDEIESQETEFAGDVLFQEVCCNRCKATWTDEYALTGYCNLETGEGESK